MSRSAKKFDLSILYLIGMAITAVGFFLPIFKGPFGGTYNGFKIFGNGDSAIKVAILLVFIGAVVGILLNFISIKNAKWFMLGALALSVASGLYVFFNSSDLAKNIAKNFLDIGFYLIVAGWIVALVGWVFKKK